MVRKRNKSIFYLLPVFFLFSLFFLACGDDDDDDDSNGYDVIMPLKVGNKWEYRTNTGALNTWEVIGSATVGGEQVAVVQIRDDQDNFWNFYLKNKADGLYGFGTEGAEITPYLMYKYPAEVGDTYTMFGMNVKVEQTDLQVSVSAGTFTCYKYVFDDYYTDMLSPNIGQVKEEDPDYTNELINYTVLGNDF